MKGLTLLSLVLLVSVPTYAKWGANCTSNGGTIIKANQYGTKDGVNLDKGGLCNDPNDPNTSNNCNGMEFCRSNKDMNWWSAFTWCESIGGKLASFEHLCPSTQMIKNSTNAAPGACPNLTGTGSDVWGWSSTGIDNCQALDVNLSTGATANFRDNCWDLDRRSTWHMKALCEEK